MDLAGCSKIDGQRSFLSGLSLPRIATKEGNVQPTTPWAAGSQTVMAKPSRHMRLMMAAISMHHSL
jgi:hypothetical protein